MDLGLVMLVKDEARRVRGALEPILDQLAEVVVYDTGSTDGTPDILRELGVEPRFGTLDPARCGALADLRNEGLASLSTPWCMTLDADERVDPAELRALRQRAPEERVGGLFVRWHNRLESGETFDDYKCAFFRSGVRKVGFIHDNVQPNLRAQGLTATWAEELVLEHRPEARKDGWKQRSYADRLACALRHAPGHPRYLWFSGYAALQQGEVSQGLALLAGAAASEDARFPVERINAAVVLVSVTEGADAMHWLRRARALFGAHAEDFEVRVNRWMGPWLAEAEAVLRSAGAPKAPRFAC